MTKRKTIVLPLAAIFLCICFTLSFAVTSYAAVPAHTTRNCTVTQITLHGTAAPTVQCKSKVGTRKGIGHNNPITGSCSSDALLLFYNGPVGAKGPVLCVTGFGLLNLNQYFGGVWWNDVASAWWTGCADVNFYLNINKGGNWAFEPGSDYGNSSPSGNFPLNTGHGTIGNDTLSSVYLVLAHLC